jgi:hypothetical protein
MPDPDIRTQLWSALGLPASATKDDARRAFDRVIADFADEPADPRQQLAALVESVAQSKGLSFHDALALAKQTRPGLVAAVAQYYATER